MTRSKHTEAARDVLARCDYLFGELQANPMGIAWEAKFSATLALLRSVGHVLDKVDGEASPAARTEIDRWWAKIKSTQPKRGVTKPEPEIFWDFIEGERNLILKEGQLRAGQSAMVELVGAAAIMEVRGFGFSISDPPEPPKQSPKASYTYHMNDGPFRGRDPRDLIAEAVEWWRDQLDLIEGKIN
jgi:hypothetical protein